MQTPQSLNDMKQTAVRKARSGAKQSSANRAAVSLLFAQGVDAGAKLALSWIEDELKRFQLCRACPRQLLSAVRAQTRLVQECSFTRSTIRAQKRVSVERDV